jgi:hypothetical protein
MISLCSSEQQTPGLNTGAGFISCSFFRPRDAEERWFQNESNGCRAIVSSSPNMTWSPFGAPDGLPDQSLDVFACSFAGQKEVARGSILGQ